MAEINDNEQVGFRKAKRSAIIESGIAPYPTRLKTTTTIKEIIKNYSDKNLEKGEETADVVSIAGRIMHIRNAGKLIFAAIQDGEHNRLQIMLNAQKLDKSKYATDDDLVNGEGRELSVGESSIKVFKRLVDLGDHIYVTGNVINSLTGELSVLVTDWEIAAKSIRPLPVLHKELSDEQRTRRRYLDMIVSKTSRHLVSVRSGVMKSLRNTFDGYNYME
ncbi:MAG: hypothetical protein LBN03_01910, partial [Bifidobacteriaceae bacterium]|nr:hypothetical protein [Bifidobacteriaceae bacterium]